MKIFLLVLVGLIVLSFAAPFIFVFEVIFIRLFIFIFVISIFCILGYFLFSGLFKPNSKEPDEMDVILEEFYKYKKNNVAFSRIESFLKKCSREFKDNKKRLFSINRMLKSISYYEKLSSLDKVSLTVEQASLESRNELIINKATSVLKIVMDNGESVDLKELDAILSKIFKN